MTTPKHQESFGATQQVVNARLPYDLTQVAHKMLSQGFSPSDFLIDLQAEADKRDIAAAKSVEELVKLTGNLRLPKAEMKLRKAIGTLKMRALQKQEAEIRKASSLKQLHQIRDSRKLESADLRELLKARIASLELTEVRSAKDLATLLCLRPKIKSVRAVAEWNVLVFESIKSEEDVTKLLKDGGKFLSDKDRKQLARLSLKLLFKGRKSETATQSSPEGQQKEIRS